MTTGVRVGTDWRALAAVSTTVLAWASAFVAIRWVGESFSAAPLAAGRLIVGSVLLGAALVLKGRWVAPTRREWALLAVCGLAWFAVYNVALNAAEQRIDAGTSAMLVNIGPILIAVFAGLFLGEGFPKWLVIGVAVAFVGAVTIGASTANTDNADLVGVVLCLLAALTYAIGVLAQKPVLGRLPALQVTWIACTIGGVACLPALPQLVTEVDDAAAIPVAGLIYLGAVPTALAFGTWAYALARMNAGKLGVSTYLAPPLAALMAWVLLDEVPPALAFVGGAICLIGVALSRRR
ncbi:DMT family transporter [Antrihabitans cavernicola]|uniref:DMT family transporter n=1 Tax=Antrihabitans cavernicola TaxID=2495913 RepID=A0A5A7SGH0_9NOCA|nr:DMT family transporter [Spelaeibacter cavernicola]KAA0024529.1 DMT family transporter [Spelaeibacter cavernicola]